MSDEEVVAVKLTDQFAGPVGVADRKLSMSERLVIEAKLLRQWELDRGVRNGEFGWEDSLDAKDATSNIWMIRTKGVW